MKKILVALLSVTLVFFGVVTFFGDNIRRLFAMSADSLAGNNAVAQYNLSGNTHQFMKPNAWTAAKKDHLSTFGIDVDTASYTLARRFINESRMAPPKESVRIEEWVNAFQYRLDAPTDLPFSVGIEGAPSPFTRGRTLVKVSVQGKKVQNKDRKPAHLVFLVDTSCSMAGADRLPLAQQSLRILTSNLNPQDTVALVTYAGNVRDVLPPTSAEDRGAIIAAIDSLSTGGGTAMGSGMLTAYQHAEKMVIKGHVSRVIVLTDGDANIGTIDGSAMLDSVSQYVKRGVTLTTVGFGMGNYRDDRLEQLADKGNGQSLYIDSEAAAKKVFAEQLAGTLEVVAKDVKIQVDFDDTVVTEYRLLGYENRAIADADFRKDDVDGGEIGAGHSVTALYELTLAEGSKGRSLGNVFVRGMQPEGVEAFEVKKEMHASQVVGSMDVASSELRFATAVAVTADILRGNEAAVDFDLARAHALAVGAANGIPERLEFIELLASVERLKRDARTVAAAP